jgi:anti-sigma factor RsiW
MNDGLEISESELHAYVDGALEANRANAVAARLAADPALAHRVAGFKADMAMLKKVYGPLGDAPVPREWLALAGNSRPAAPAYSWRLVSAIAAVLLVAVVLAPFAYRQLASGRSGEIVTAALSAREASAEKTINVAGDAGQYDAAISSAITEKVKVPDLGKMGYQLSTIRFYPDAPGGRAAELVYRSQDNRLFTLYLRRSDGTARFDQFERQGLRVCVWQDDQLGMVMAGNVSTAAMQRLASLAYTGLTL